MKKNYQIVSKAFVIAVALLLPGMLLAQNANREDGSDKLYYQWYLNLNGGLTQGYGDILEGTWQGDMLTGESASFSGGLRLGKHISPVFGIYGSFFTGGLKGISGEDTKNLRYETDFNEFLLGTTVSFSNLIGGYKPRLVNIYGTAGLGLIDFDAQAFDKDTDVPVNEGYPNTTETTIPVGAGIDFRLSNRWDINLETTFRVIDGDKLDGYESGENTDAFLYTSVGLGYSFWRPKSGAKIEIETEPSMLALHGDSIPIEIKGTIPESFNKKAVVDFTPVLVYGDQSKQLEPLYLQGEEVAPEYQKDGAVVVPATGGSFTYKTYVKYEPGMDVCELSVEPLSSIKGKTPKSLGNRKIADGLIMTSKRLNNTEQVLLADHGYQRDIIVTEKGKIYFVVNRHDLNFNYKLNKSDAAKAGMTEMKEFIEKGWEIKDIRINAWASPEGEESFNQGLSQRRAESAEKYARKEYDKYIKAKAKELGVPEEDIKQDLDFKLAANGEDWDGFMQALQESDIKDKNIIANVVNSQPDPAKREQEIRNMTVIYKEIEDDILPPLRRAVIAVNSYEPSLTDGEIAEYSSSAPDSLSINELLYAATLTEDANTKLRIYKTVIQQYPNDWRGYNNAGTAATELGDYDAAANYYAKAKSIASDNGIVLNNNGAMASKNGDFEAAKKDYMAAQKEGVNVNYNMGIVKVSEGNYNGAINSFSGKKCDYNLALAHTLAGNYNAATSTLNCADKTPEVYYLQSIIGARTNNDSMVFENLKKAIEGDAGYKQTAKDDKEFMKYYANPEFMNIVQ
jgi:tetratricopeptide (TPR) repeat protein